MRVRSIASLLLCGVTLLAVSPSKAYAQLAAQPAVIPKRDSLSVEPLKPKPRLKEAFAGEVAKNRGRVLTEADIKRLEKESLFPQTTPSSSGFTKKEAVLVVLLVVAIVGLAIMIANNTEEQPPDCSLDPSDFRCL